MAGELIGDVAEDQKASKLKMRYSRSKRDLKTLVRDLRQKKEKDIEDLTAQIDELEDERRCLMASISNLKQAAKVESVGALKEAIGQSDRKRSLEQERKELVAKLRQDGDGKSLEDLEKECGGVRQEYGHCRSALSGASYCGDRRLYGAGCRASLRCG